LVWHFGQWRLRQEQYEMASFVTTTNALIAMGAERSGSATRDRGEHLELRPA
jgi:hypothetical protein